MQSVEAKDLARRTAVGACSLAAQGRREDMGTLIGLYMKDCGDIGMAPCDAFVILNSALIGLVLHTVGDDAEEFLGNIAQHLAVSP